MVVTPGGGEVREEGHSGGEEEHGGGEDSEEEHGVGEEELRNTRSYWQRSSDPAGPARL